LGSVGEVEVADALAVMVPTVEGVAPIVIVAARPPHTVPTLQRTMNASPSLDEAHVPWVVLNHLRSTHGGRTSVAVTPHARVGPLLRTTTVYETCWPLATGSGDSTFVTETSADLEDPVAIPAPATRQTARARALLAALRNIGR
jgi:hypothetical protein